MTPSPEEHRFIEQLREGFAPGPMPPARRAALRAAVEARLEGRSWRWLLVPALGGAVAAGLAAWLVLFSPSSPVNGPGADLAALDWEEEILFSEDLLESEGGLDAERRGR
jgi:hypothetical protein